MAQAPINGPPVDTFALCPNLLFRLVVGLLGITVVFLWAAPKKHLLSSWLICDSMLTLMLQPNVARQMVAALERAGQNEVGGVLMAEHVDVNQFTIAELTN